MISVAAASNCQQMPKFIIVNYVAVHL